MKLSRSEFNKRYAEGTLRVALVGMSNIGKSYSGLRLAADFDFSLIEVDKFIWEELGEESLTDFAAWQGQPYSDGYDDREAQSMKIEARATLQSMETRARNPLLDTTGSVIYAGEEVLETLQRDWFVVYIEAVEEHLERLKSQYFEQPKPLAWAGHFRMIEGLDETASLLACYPDLLKSRAEQYSAIADRTIGSDAILTPDTEVLFDLIRPPVQ